MPVESAVCRARTGAGVCRVVAAVGNGNNAGVNAKCPKCEKPAVRDESNPTRPFCSERCRLLDLGGWLSGQYAIPGEPVVDETEPGDEAEPTSKRH